MNKKYDNIKPKHDAIIVSRGARVCLHTLDKDQRGGASVEVRLSEKKKQNKTKNKTSF